MVVTPQEKAEFVAYQLKDVSRVLYEQSKDERTVREGQITWEMLKNISS